MVLAKLRVLILSSAYCTTCMIQISAFHPPATPAMATAAARTYDCDIGTTTSLALSAGVQVTSPSTKRAAPSEVADLFDDYASSFESSLVDNLKYSAPKDVAKAAAERIQDTETNTRQGRLYSSALDAGCGTGLAAPYIRSLVDGPLVGIDISPKMAELAAELIVDDGPVPVAKDRMRRCTETARLALGSDKPGGPPKRLYEGVFTGDLLDLSGSAKFLDGYGHDVCTIPTEPFDLIVSADVLCYFGAMDDILQAFADRLAVGGDVIFTTETMSAGDYNWVRLPSLRYAHCPEYVARMAKEAGLSMVSQVAFTPRMEAGEKVLGTLHTFTKSE